MLNVNLIKSLLITEFCCFISTHAQWDTTMKSYDFVAGHYVAGVDYNIVMESCMVTTWSTCLQYCTRLMSIKSAYYDRNTYTCFCNNNTDTNPASDNPGHGITYWYATRGYELQNNNGNNRIYIPNGIFDNCNEIFNSGYTENAMYRVRYSTTSFTDMDCLGEWTVFQRRIDGSVDFYRNWTDYVNGFGSPSGELWLGLASLHQLTKNGSCELYIYLEAGSTNPTQTEGYASYSSFQIGDAETNYMLYVSGFSGDVGDSFSPYHNGQQFTTKDRKNNNGAFKCAQMFKGGWWYKGCHNSNLNGLYLNGNHTSYADGVNWANPWGLYYSLLKTEMKLRCT